MKSFESGETYIGDGLYASFDGWQIRLRAWRGSEDHEVFLEPGVWASLVEYVGGLSRQDCDSILNRPTSTLEST
jgi:hypothetical protein